MNDTPQSLEVVVVSLLRKLDSVDLTTQERALLRAILREAADVTGTGETADNLSFSDEFASAFTSDTADPPGSASLGRIRGLISRTVPDDERDQSPDS